MTAPTKAASTHGQCYACDRSLGTKKPVEVWTIDGQMQWVGPDCGHFTIISGYAGYQPPKGGPRLFNCAELAARAHAKAQS